MQKNDLIAFIWLFMNLAAFLLVNRKVLQGAVQKWKVFIVRKR